MELTANIFIILSAILAATSMYFYLKHRYTNNQLKIANSLLKSEEGHRIQLSTQIVLCEQEKGKIEEQSKKSLIEIKELESKLKFAINNPPKFKVGAKIKNVIVESIEIEKTKTKWIEPLLTGIICGLVAGLNSYKEKNKEKYIYKYTLHHKDACFGQQLHKECEVLTEEQLLKLKNNKTNQK